MAFEPENPLERALVRAAQEPDARPEFYRLLMASELCIGGRAGDNGETGGPVKLEHDDEMHLTVVERDGRKLHPIFTAPSRAQHFSAKMPWFRLLGRDLFASAKGASFVLNPGSEAGKELAPEEIQYWLAQLVGRRIEINAKRTILPSETHPANLTKALRVLFANRQVASARLADMRLDAKSPRLILAIDTDDNWRKLSSEISAIVEEIVPGTELELVRLNRQDNRNPHTKQLLAIAPFFEREPSAPTP